MDINWNYTIIQEFCAYTNRKGMLTHLIINGTSKINTTASVSNNKTKDLRFLLNLNHKSKFARKRQPISVITLMAAPQKHLTL